MARKAVVDFEIKGQNGINTVKQLEDRVRILRKEWRNAGDEASRALKGAEFRTANLELQRHGQMVKQIGGAWGDFKKNFLSVATGVLGGNAITVAAQFLLGIIPGLITGAGKLDDSLANIRKTTGLSKSEVRELNKDLKSIDTRTSREELRKLASEAGKLGKESKQDILEFVSAADKINVALGEDLGEGGVTKIGKITQTFDLEKLYGTEQALLKVGSAVNAVGAASTANEKNLVEFTFRTQGLASIANISVPDILGYAATLDIAGQSMEVSATVVNKLFVAMGQDVPKFAKLAKMGIGDFAKLLQTDANEALITVLENVKGNNKGLLAMGEILKKLGLDGQESVSVVGALAGKTQTLREQQALANTEYARGTSIVDEFNIKNNTTAGILEKISKWWESLTNVGSGGWVDGMVRWFGKFVGALSEIDLLIVDTASDIAELDASNQKLAGNEKKLTPLIGKYEELKGKTKLNNEEQVEMKRVIGEIAGIVPSAVTELDNYGKAMDINTGKVKEFLRIQKDFLKVQNQEQITRTEDELKQLNKQLEYQKKTRLEARKISEEMFESDRVVTTPKSVADYKNEDEAIAKLNRAIEMKSNYLKKLNGTYLDALNGTPTTTPAATPTPTLGAGNLGKEHESEVKKYAREEEELQKEIRKLRNQTEVELLEGKEKEIKQVEGKYAELKLKAQGHGAELKAITELEEAEKNNITIKYEVKLNEAVAKVYEDRRREQMSDQEREIVLAMEKYDKLLEMTGVTEEKMKEIIAAEAAEIEAIRKKYFGQGEDVFVKSLIELERLKNEANQGLDTQEMAGAIDPQAAKIKRLEIEQEYIAAEWLLYATAGQERMDLAEEWMAKEQELNIDRAAFTKRIDEEIKASTYSLADARNQAWASGIGAMRGFFKQSTIMYKALFLAEKALAVADVIIKGARERAAIRAAYAPLGPLGVVPMELQLGISRIRTITSVGEIAAQTIAEVAFKKEGGYTDMQTMYGKPSGYVSSPTLFNLGRRSFIAGEAGQEFVINNDALRNPVVANFTRMIDVMQKTGDFSQLSGASGGSTADMTGHLVGLRSDIQKMNRLLQENNKRPLTFNYSAFEEFQDFINEIRDSVSG